MWIGVILKGQQQPLESSFTRRCWSCCISASNARCLTKGRWHLAPCYVSVKAVPKEASSHI